MTSNEQASKEQTITDCNTRALKDIIVRIFKGELEVACKLIPGPLSAEESYTVLQNANARWVGTLIQPTNNDLLTEQRELTPGKVYHLHLHRQAGEQQSTRSTVGDRERTAKFLQLMLPHPESYAREGDGHSLSRKLKELLLLLRASRTPYKDWHLQQLPVALLDSILGQVEEDCAYGTPAAQDTDFAQKLIPNEAARMEKFWEMASSEFGVHFERVVADREQTGDEYAAVVTSQILAIGANLKVELDEDRDDTDPRLQSFCPATLYSSDDRRKLRASCRCPTLLIELSGHNLSLSGFAYGKDPCCDQLSQTVSLLWQPKSELMIGAARIVLAMRLACSALQAFYLELESKPKRQKVLWELNWPYPRTYTHLDDMQRRGFSYHQRITNLTFVAIKDECAADYAAHSRPFFTPNPQHYLFIKFCKSYSVEAHKALQAAGFAPRLLGFEQLPGRWFMVVMECLAGTADWEDMDGVVYKKPKDALRAAVAVLHASGFVHGDLRGCNVRADKHRVYLTDLEWAGKMGEAKYPIFMNRADIDWPPGAGDNELITKEHDLYMMNKMLSE